MKESTASVGRSIKVGAGERDDVTRNVLIDKGKIGIEGAADVVVARITRLDDMRFL
jgi:hypothetical protein